MFKRSRQEVIHSDRESNRHWQGVEALGFEAVEFPTSQGRYHAIGVYRVDGRLKVCKFSSEFYSRVPATAKDLYLDTLYTVAEERENARYIAQKWSGLSPEVTALLNQAAEQE